MKIFFIILGSLIGLFVILSLLVAILVVHFTVKPKYLSLENRIENNKALGYLDIFKREDMTITMSDGYVINGTFALNDPNKLVILTHGHGNNREGVIKFARLFYRIGYSVFFYDMRSHGINKRQYLTMGCKESYDLYEIIRYFKALYPNAEIGIHGVSMGASTSLITLKHTQDLSFVIADCPYSSLKKEYCDSLLTRKLIPHLSYLFAKILVKIFYKFSFKDIQPAKDVIGNTVPVLLIHGTADDIVLQSNQNIIAANLNNCFHQEVLFDTAKHMQSLDVNETKYETTVKEFLSAVHNLH